MGVSGFGVGDSRARGSRFWFGFWVRGSGVRVVGFRFEVSGSGFWVRGLGFGFRGSGLGFRVLGF